MAEPREHPEMRAADGGSAAAGVAARAPVAAERSNMTMQIAGWAVLAVALAAFNRRPR